MLQPRPALADRVENRLSARAMESVLDRLVDRQYLAVHIDCDMRLEPHNLLLTSKPRAIAGAAFTV